MLRKFWTHTDAGIPDDKIEAGIAGLRPLFLNNADTDGSARFCKFDGVAHKVQKDLVQPQLITDDILIHNIHRINEKIQPLSSNI